MAHTHVIVRTCLAYVLLLLRDIIVRTPEGVVIKVLLSWKS